MTALQKDLERAITQALTEIDDPGPIQPMRSVGGGCINNASQVVTPKGSYFLKWNAAPLPNMFTAEAKGLQLLAATNTIRLPVVIKVQEAEPDLPAFILMEWIERRSGFDQRLCGQQLAQLHLNGTSDDYGLDNDNYIGSTPQYNGWQSDWVEFFREKRLQPQIELAIRNGRCDATRRKKLEKLLSRLDEWLGGVNRMPSLLHGDLWGGNVIGDEKTNPVLIDPAVYYGDREADLAFTQMFGGFSQPFYHAYNETYPLEADYQKRFELYNIYHTLNHLNLFGESYGYSLDGTLRRFVG
ncbi:MAG TPA: fructosamine kinase family protein [Anaerolineaceae bacterium]|nr:fructosamine kinase family protein [Anaerolineaceae bacterium]